MYVTKYTAIDALRYYADRQMLHKELCKACGDVSRDNGNILYSMEFAENEIVMYVQSNNIPDEIPGFKIANRVNISNIFKMFLNNAVFNFEVATSPYKSNKGKKHYIRDEENRLKWLERQGEKYGFQVLRCCECDKSTVRFKHAKDRGGQGEQTIYKYAGVLRITDEKLFCNAYKKGLGPGKAYGLGLIKVF